MVGEAGVNEHIIQRPLRVLWHRGSVGVVSRCCIYGEEESQQQGTTRTTKNMPSYHGSHFSGSSCLSICVVAA